MYYSTSVQHVLKPAPDTVPAAHDQETQAQELAQTLLLFPVNRNTQLHRTHLAATVDACTNIDQT